MIKQTKTKKGKVKLTFTLPLKEQPDAVSVTGDFNGWDPYANPLKKRSNGTRSTTVEIAPGEPVQFKYLGDNGYWFTDQEVGTTSNGNNVVVI